MNKIIQGDSLKILKTLELESIDCVITSPPYWALRDYGVEGQLGLEPTFQEYIKKLCDIFGEVRRVLKKEGTCWVNLGDTYGGSGKGVNRNGLSSSTLGSTDRRKKINGLTKESWVFKNVPKTVGDIEKSLCQIPSRFAIEMSNRGWILRNEIIWHKPNCMPSSVTDRFTVDFEKVFFFVKNKKYYFETQYENYAPASDVRYRIALRNKVDYETKEPYKGNTPYMKKYKKDITATVQSKEGNPSDHLVAGGFNPEGKNKRTVWSVNTKGYSEAHFATFPEKLIEPMVMAGCPKEGIVMDIFMGAGITAVVAKKLGRNYLGIELNKDYIKIAENRISGITLPML